MIRTNEHTCISRANRVCRASVFDKTANQSHQILRCAASLMNGMRRAPNLLSLTPEGWVPFEEGDRVVFNELSGTVSRVPPTANGPTDKVTFLADGRRRGRRVETRLLAHEKKGEVPESPVGPADATKDKALIDAFSAAIAAALGEEAA